MKTPREIRGASSPLSVSIPGVICREIRSEFGGSQSVTVRYHLGRLEKAGKVASNRHGFYRYYFPAGLFQDNEKNLLEVLSHETARDIVMFVIEQKSPTQSEIAEEFGGVAGIDRLAHHEAG